MYTVHAADRFGEFKTAHCERFVQVMKTVRKWASKYTDATIYVYNEKECDECSSGLTEEQTDVIWAWIDLAKGPRARRCNTVGNYHDEMQDAGRSHLIDPFSDPTSRN